MKKYLLLILLLMLFPAQMAISKDKYVMDNGVRIKIPTKFEKKLLQNVDENGEGFYEVGELLEGRYFHAATLLQDGRIFVSGGEKFVGLELSSTELFDPKTGKSVPGPNMIEGRELHVTHLMPDGRVLILGGFQFSDVSKYVEIYDPVTNTIEVVSEIPYFRLIQNTAFVETINDDEVLFFEDTLNSYGIYKISTNKLNIYPIQRSTTGSYSYIGRVDDTLYATTLHYFSKINVNELSKVGGKYDKSHTYNSGIILPDKKHILLLDNSGTKMAIYSISDGKYTEPKMSNYPHDMNNIKLLPDGNILYRWYTRKDDTHLAELKINENKYTIEEKPYVPLDSGPVVQLKDGRLLFVGGVEWNYKTSGKVYLWSGRRGV